MKNKLTIKDKLTEFLLYTTPNGDIKVEIFFHNENIWLTQKRMAELFGVNVPAVSKHLNNIYESNELEKDATISILETVQNEGNRLVNRNIEYKILEGKGKISAKQAEEKAFIEYDKFNRTRIIESDFDKVVKALKNKK